MSITIDVLDNKGPSLCIRVQLIHLLTLFI